MSGAPEGEIAAACGPPIPVLRRAMRVVQVWNSFFAMNSWVGLDERRLLNPTEWCWHFGIPIGV